MIVKDIIEYLGITIVKDTGKELYCLCPFHEDSKPSFNINSYTGAWQCWNNCAKGRNIYSLVSLILNISIEEAKLEIDKGFSPTIWAANFQKRLRVTEVTDREDKVDLSFLKDLPLAIDNEGGKYLKSRNFNDETIKFWEILFFGKNRGIIIPIKDFQGNLVGYLFRSIDRKEFRYSKGFKSGDCLFGVNHLDKSLNTMNLVEGCFPKGTKVLCKGSDGSITRSAEGIALVNKNIEDVKVGDRVLSFNEKTHKKELKKVSNVFSRVTRDLITLEFSNGNVLKCTPDHPIAVVNKGNIAWIEANDMQIGDNCLQSRYNGLARRIRCLEFANARRGKTLTQIFGAQKAEEMIKKNREVASKILKAIKHSPNRSEIFLKSYLDKICPNKFDDNTTGEITRKYGLDVDGLIPDFIWVEGRKIILFHGCSWHCCEKCAIKHPMGLLSEEVRSRDSAVYKRLVEKDWQVLVIWHHELRDLDALSAKISDFVFNPNSEIISLVSKGSIHNYGQRVYNLDIESNNNFFAFGILVHNCLDAIWLWQNNFKNSVSSFTCSVSANQADIILALCRELNIMYDSDVAGFNGSEDALKELNNRVLIKRVILPEGKDPCDCNKDEILKAIKVAKYTFLRSKNMFNNDHITVIDKVNLKVEAAIELIKSIKNIVSTDLKSPSSCEEVKYSYKCAYCDAETERSSTIPDGWVVCRLRTEYKNDHGEAVQTYVPGPTVCPRHARALGNTFAAYADKK